MDETLIDKIGNSVIYLSNHCEGLHNKTNLLKLIYILDEVAIKESGVPFFNLNYKVWQYGPVYPDLYNSANTGLKLFKDYFEVNNSKVVPIKEFNDDEFSDNEIKILEIVCDRFKYCTANELVNHTHKPGSPWYVVAKENNLLNERDELKTKTTDLNIDMSVLVQENESKLFRYKQYLENL